MHGWGKKCNSSVNYSYFKPWRYIYVYVYILSSFFFFWCFASFCILWMNYLELIPWIMGAKFCGSIMFPCCWCILWFGLIVHLDSARTKTSRRVSWCQLWVESGETESGEWCKNSLVKWWWGEWNLEPASNSPTGKIFVLYLSQVFLLIPGNLPSFFWTSLAVQPWFLTGGEANTKCWLALQLSFFAKEKVTISFPSSIIVMSNSCLVR